MLRIIKALLLGLVILGITAAAIVFTGNAPKLFALLTGPQNGWDLSKKAPEPDYSKTEYWAALPGQQSLALMVPEGVAASPGAARPAVFFVHPTGHLHGGDWNSPLDPNSRTEENTKWMMANQASVFSSCCDIYAPRYREASIYRYIAAPEDIGQKAMDFAYADVVRAFENFLGRIGPDAPFILASHSQGTTHGFRLLAERIDGTPAAERLIAAYLIGSKVKEAEAVAMKTVKVCDAAEQTSCLIHYAAFGPKGNPDETMDGLVCVNPLNWRKDGGPAEAQAHKGAVLPSGRFQNAFFTRDTATGVVFGPLGKPLPGLASARCEKGLLWVSEQTHPQLKALVMRGDNYHGLEYPLFHMDLRLNVEARIAAFANARGRPQP